MFQRVAEIAVHTARLSIESITSFLMAALIVVSMIQVVGRYVLGGSPIWSVELAGYLLVWIVFLGAVLALKDGQHIKIDVLRDLLPVRARRVFDVATSILMIIVLGILIREGYRLAAGTWDQSATSFDFSKGAIYSAICVSAIMMMIVVVRDMFIVILNIQDSDHGQGTRSCSIVDKEQE